MQDMRYQHGRQNLNNASEWLLSGLIAGAQVLGPALQVGYREVGADPGTNSGKTHVHPVICITDNGK